MERESFENKEIAELMNEHFVSIKVDREERSDVDQIYMEALQTMGLQGGWPLNVFTFADQRPFYGGTYFPPASWKQILLNIHKAYQENKDQLTNSAEEFANALSVSEGVKYGLGDTELIYSKDILQNIANGLKLHFDDEHGGIGNAPKFPNPAIWQFLLHANHFLSDNKLSEQIKLTLDNMALGGIYDHLGGGFARYSIDKKWFAPHFEKMLYDNAQMVSLYSQAYQVYKDDLYREIVYNTISFVENELMSSEGAFYSALDADSEGVEGLYYTWTHQELVKILQADEKLFSDLYNITSEGNWEDGRNILFIESSRKHEIIDAEDDFSDKLRSIKKKLFAARSGRIRPGLDDKTIAAWNALMIKGLTDAYRAFGEKSFLDMAQTNAELILSKMNDGPSIWRIYKDGEANGNGTLEDYSLLIQAFISLYQADFNERWISVADRLTAYVIENFHDPQDELFFYTDASAEKLIARKKEIFDNVIPSSNSVMAMNLFQLAILTENNQYQQLSDQMINHVFKLIKEEPRYMANWALLYSDRTMPTLEIALVGADINKLLLEMGKDFIPNKVVTGTTGTSNLPLLKNRSDIGGRATVYVCFNKTCKLPVHSVEDALLQIRQIWGN
jgi:uncharacterized protein YyaL (SSP411 family)